MAELHQCIHPTLRPTVTVFSAEDYDCSYDYYVSDNNPADNFSYTITEESGFPVTFEFMFNFQIKEEIWRRYSANPQAFNRCEMHTSIKIQKDQLFNDEEESSKFIDDNLRLWLFHDDDRRSVVQFALGKAYKAIDSLENDSKWNAIEICCPVTIEHHHIIYDERMPPPSMEVAAGGAGMVPAKESSIEMLTRVAMPMDSEESCTVCLEELRGEWEGVAMPCGHVFHGDCIKQWLRTSHYCPLCRFQLPKQN
ncbi:uncharacterized protein LOC127242202 [Andrographis paniculata]|uniref:uncharacterized protein LOC127242202 n=1 Tax=Andrographis paniculata TaxID=175694 RepID=UPI0021E8C450|nr:uncharacterized protein LOC127242202 [Andrographis paniculata]